MRKSALFNNNWKFVKTAKNADEAAKLQGECVNLPHTWNAKDGQDGGNDYYRGTCWYVKTFKKPEIERNGEVWLEFRGVAMTAEVYLNGKKLSTHEGGFSTFRVDITKELIEDNVLVVSVDNSKNNRVYPQKADFTFYGGIYRDVYLITVPKKHFDLGFWGGPAIKVTPKLDKSLTSAEITVETWISGNADQVKMTVDNQSQLVSVKDGYAKTQFCINPVHLWNGKKDPFCYTAKAELDGDCIETSFGCRKMEWDSEKGFFLNKKRYPLCGAARHQDRQGAGNAITKEMMSEDMNIMLEMGVNTIRLAHYQHDQYFYDLCDRTGMVVWVEIPYISEHMPTARENTLSQMRELVVQNYNHPSIACWGLSNEITVAGGMGEDMTTNHVLLNDLCHQLDATRPTTMAHAFMLDTEDPFVTIPDICAYNLYYGWYLGEMDDNDSWFDEFHKKHPNVIIGLSEYGADANPAYQSGTPEKGDWSESYQALYHEHMLKMWKERPYIWAMHCWNMFDFGADGRSEGGKPGQNQKGLVTFDRKTKKDAFYVYKAFLSENPFVHLCGRRYIDRTEKTTKIKVYSNQKEVTLYVDGKEWETKKADYIFSFMVPITGRHRIVAKSGMLEDVMEIQYVTKANPSYSNMQGEILNWFDKKEEMVKDGYYSIFDKVADIKKSSEANEILEQMMKIARASFGDVAKVVKSPESVQRIKDAQPLNKVLKQASKAFTADMIKEFNHKLNQIKKCERKRIK